ncbi:ADP-ribosylglycohydrolase family protein [Paeniglutamicibacter sp. NPDC091659]|uniref:ADP-ribosylglycohydrolase family protein n=1 Tax=Paeniglutamicibacter sp. NPDC091659 TaxID=3364389 RepID=UPI0037F708BB
MTDSIDPYAIPADFSDRVFGVLLAAVDAATHARDGQEPGESETLSLFLLDGLLEALEWANDGVASDEAACMWLAGLRWYKLVIKSFPEGSPVPQPRWIDEAFEGAEDFAPGDPQHLLALVNSDMASVGRPAFPDADTTGVLSRAAFMALLPRVDESTTHKLATDAAALTHGSPLAHRAAGQAALVVRAALENGSASAPRWAELVAGLKGTAAEALRTAVAFVTEALENTDPQAAYDALFELLGEEPDVETASFAGALLAAVLGTDAVAHRPASVLDPILDQMHERWIKLTVGS